MIVLDLGGTWFRSALQDGDGNLRLVRNDPALSFRTCPELTVPELQDALVEFVLARTGALRSEEPTGRTVAVSLGAAIDAQSGVAIGSAPLWGPDAPPLHLAERLRADDPDTEWVVLNDVTAKLTYFASKVAPPRPRKLALVTVSSGIALRTLDLAANEVVVDAKLGIQGEIGHLPAHCELDDERLQLDCDCGAPNHVSAFCSGRGVEAVLERAGFGAPGGADAGALFGVFAAALAAGDPRAEAVLRAVTRPLARVLVYYLAVDPHVEKILLTGGVVEGLGRPYLDALVAAADADGAYGLSDRDPGFFAARLEIAPDERDAGLKGAGLYAARHHTRRPGGGRSWTVAARQPVEYVVSEVTDVFDPENPALRETARIGPRDRDARLVVVDADVDELYGERLRSYFSAQGVTAILLVLTAGEGNKHLEDVLRVVRAMDAALLPRRRAPVVAVGGGVLLDIVGLAASLYRRGTPYVRVPTTLIGLVDAGVGVKTAVNLDGAKSKLGTYFAPSSVLLDLAFVATLPRRHVCNGVAEIVKMALVRDRALFDLLDDHVEMLVSTRFQDGLVAPEVVRRAVSGMLGELEPNLWETNLERIVDFGHTFSPAIEMDAAPPLLHGEAVAVDMALSLILATNRSLMSAAEAERALRLLARSSLPLFVDACRPDVLWEALQAATRHRDGRQRLPLPDGIGRSVFVNDVTREELVTAVKTVEERAARHG